MGRLLSIWLWATIVTLFSPIRIFSAFLSGLNFERELRASPIIASAPFITLTDRIMIEDILLMEEAGSSEMLFKPFK